MSDFTRTGSNAAQQTLPPRAPAPQPHPQPPRPMPRPTAHAEEGGSNRSEWFFLLKALAVVAVVLGAIWYVVG